MFLNKVESPKIKLAQESFRRCVEFYLTTCISRTAFPDCGRARIRLACSVNNSLPTGQPVNERLIMQTADALQPGGTAAVPASNGPGGEPTAWKKIVLKYQQPSWWRGSLQLITSLVPLAVLWYLIHLTLAWSWWATLPLVVLGAGFMVRLFIIHHDCGHGSFFKSPTANDAWGYLTGVLTFTPYQLWRQEHAIHHSASGDLDRRGAGSLWTMTVQEYLAAPRWERLAYRLMRNPGVLFVVGPLFLFVVQQRFCPRQADWRARRSVYLTNLGIVGMAIGMSAIFGFKAYLVVQLTMILIAGSAGVWLFYVQHQFEGVYWQRHGEWDYVAAALQGSSFYKLPAILQWFSGNIGFHHIHHLSPRIPNYNLARCHDAEPLFQTVPPITLLASLKSLGFHLWDEERQRLVGFGHLRHLRRRKKFQGIKPSCGSVG